jgi:hypothetical protein
MNPSSSTPAENREVEQLRAFIDETTAEVTDAKNKSSHQDDLVDAFNGDTMAEGYAAAIARADKFEARLVAAKARQDAAYNRYTSTVESTSKTVVVIARKASDKEVDAKANDNKFLKRKLKEPEEWKDSTGKTHKKHKMAFDACKSMSSMLWELLDHHRDDMSQSGDAKATAKEVHLSELLSYSDMVDKLENMSVREILEFALNTVHEQSVVVYLTHHYIHDVVTAFTGDLLYMVDKSVPT